MRNRRRSSVASVGSGVLALTLIAGLVLLGLRAPLPGVARAASASNAANRTVAEELVSAATTPPPPEPIPDPAAGLPTEPSRAYGRVGPGRRDAPLPIQLALIGEGADESNRPSQRLRVTLGPGSTLSHVAWALYDDPVGPVDELFQVVRDQHPDLRSPSSVYPGLEFDALVDPATAFVIYRSETLADGTQRRVYFNGAIETLTPKSRPINYEIELPRRDGVTEYRVPVEEEIVTAPPGTRLLRYFHSAPAEVGPLLEELYGVASAPAAAHFTQQVGWQIGRPPKENEPYFLRIPLGEDFRNRPSVGGAWVARVPGAEEQYAKLRQEREGSGIRLIEVTPTEHRFQVTPPDPTVSAADIAALIYGRADQAWKISLAAHSGDMGALPKSSDVSGESLFGSDFSVVVPLEEEWFVAAPPDDEGWITLLNGTLIRRSGDSPAVATESSSGAREASDGRKPAPGPAALSGSLPAPGASDAGPETRAADPEIKLAVLLPSGYRKYLYRPAPAKLAVFDAIVFVEQMLFGSFKPLDPADSRLEGQLGELKADRQKRLPQVIWDWDPSVPRSFGDFAERVDWAEGEPDQTIAIVLQPRSNLTIGEVLARERLTFRLIAPAILVAVIAVGLFAWRLSTSRRYLWGPRAP